MAIWISDLSMVVVLGVYVIVSEQRKESGMKGVVRARHRGVAAAGEAGRAVLPHHLPQVVVLRDTSSPHRPPPEREAVGGSASHSAQL
ncbi:hypothetical protein C2S53_018955 [Perilla frutescens var. hirtella]|uniref:Uncharacterized protein n=1 Tax=Perilla frutescens var. hirtella TaxID=608512 RepID=A0AAD4IT61_PERFH|nr:hypothetical protein C2S53_018955 [Perilla frutescens var. hirtella]